MLSDVSDWPVMQELINEFMVWAERWKLQIPECKCCVLTIGNNTSSTYHLKGVQLLNANVYGDLGVLDDDH